MKYNDTYFYSAVFVFILQIKDLLKKLGTWHHLHATIKGLGRKMNYTQRGPPETNTVYPLMELESCHTNIFINSLHRRVP